MDEGPRIWVGCLAVIFITWEKTLLAVSSAQFNSDVKTDLTLCCGDCCCFNILAVCLHPKLKPFKHPRRNFSFERDTLLSKEHGRDNEEITIGGVRLVFHSEHIIPVRCCSTE